MRRLFVLVSFMTAAVAALLPARARAQNASPLAGIWTLNRSLSEFPSDIGFDMSWMLASSGGSQSAGSNTGGRGRRGSAGGGDNRGTPAPCSLRPKATTMPSGSSCSRRRFAIPPCV